MPLAGAILNPHQMPSLPNIDQHLVKSTRFERAPAAAPGRRYALGEPSFGRLVDARA